MKYESLTPLAGWLRRIDSNAASQSKAVYMRGANPPASATSRTQYLHSKGTDSWWPSITMDEKRAFNNDRFPKLPVTKLPGGAAGQSTVSKLCPTPAGGEPHKVVIPGMFHVAKTGEVRSTS